MTLHELNEKRQRQGADERKPEAYWQYGEGLSEKGNDAYGGISLSLLNFPYLEKIQLYWCLATEH